MRRGPAPILDHPAWLTLHEGARHVRVSDRTLRRWRDLGRLQVFEVSSHRVLVRVADLEALIRPRQRVSLSAAQRRALRRGDSGSPMPAGRAGGDRHSAREPLRGRSDEKVRPPSSHAGGPATRSQTPPPVRTRRASR